MADLTSLKKDHDQPSHHELSDLVSLREFKEKIIEIHKQIWREGLEGASNNDIQQSMNLSDDLFVQCVDSCNPEKLTPEPLTVLQKHKRGSLPKDSGLESIDNLNVSENLIGLSNMLSFPGTSVATPTVFPGNLVQCPEIVMTVLMYHSIQRKPYVEYQVLGCQLLSELKDALFCPRDYVIRRDYSNDHQLLDKSTTKDFYSPSQSGYFFINNTFYNDDRNVEADDYSSTIIKWVESNPERLAKSSRLNHFKQASMHDTKFEQLSLRLGYPYLYCHHGNCEHGIVFTDLRCFSPSDDQDKRKYPLFSRHCKILRRRCCVCEEFTASWVTIDDELATESPAYFCKTCFSLLHYDDEGTKSAEFKAYPYCEEITALLDANARRLKTD